MFSHVFVGSNDLERSKNFYDALFAATGGPAGKHEPARNRVVWFHKGAAFMAAKPINGEPATPANGGTIGWGFASPAEVDAWHAAGIAHGGTTCEDPPGERAGKGLYLAYLRDPDGNKLCAMHRLA